MPKVMIDLETLGTDPGSVIISIGAVCFCPETDTVKDEFYQTIDVVDSVSNGLTMDASTVMWWMDQSDAARSALKGGAPLDIALRMFSMWISKYGPDVEVWGNGSDFDNVLLAEAFAIAGIEQPWKYYRNRCFRTLKSCAPDMEMVRIGEHHNALDDARSQAHHANQIFRHMLVAGPSKNPAEQPH